ncbi:Hypothetical_protein [Hexamita inflata]|uniref:Hypothetical_protein n=1 Tax=Hexamita inflata TaxID=28002 RepID=A0AA86PES9_9EUKA|nr:Hypothetical protein HINF_LOCUS24371 [Hexamita inflata]
MPKVDNLSLISVLRHTLTVAMIGINVSTATINVNQVSFKPNTYNVGNGSSYLFGSSVSGANSIEISSLTIIIGNSSNFMLLGSMVTTSSNRYLFGGITAYINTASSINVNSVILDSYQKFSTGYVQSSGFLVGYVDSSSINVTLKNLCLQQNMTTTTLEFLRFGLIGESSGNTSIQNASVTFSVPDTWFNCFGIVGRQNSNSFAEVINLRTSVSINSSNGDNVGSVFGYEGAKNCSVKNTNVVGGNISGSNYVGGIIGDQYNNMTIMNSSVLSSNLSGLSQIGGIIGDSNPNANATILDYLVQNSNFSGSYQVGGIIGYCYSSKLYLTNVQIKFVRITSSSDSGVVVGKNNGGTYSFITSTASSNYINSVKQTDCVSLSNSKPLTGC